MTMKRAFAGMMIVVGVASSLPTAALALTPPQICRDAVANGGRKFVDRLLKLSSRCEVARAKGRIGPSHNCQTNLVDIVPPELQQEDLVAGVYAARAALAAQIEPACVGVVAEAGVGPPCRINDGISFSGDLAGCIIYDGHGRYSARLQAMLFVPQPLVMDAAMYKCRAEITKSVIKWAKHRLSNARVCGKAAAVGRSCDLTRMNAKLALIADKLRAKVLARCTEAVPMLWFGGACASPFPDWSENFACVMAATAQEVGAMVGLAHPGTGY